MGKDISFIKSARQISKLMRKDMVEIFKSVPTKNEIGEVSDDEATMESLGIFRANVTTPPEVIGEEVQGTVRTHYYEITLDPDVALPLEGKIFVKLVDVRQGEQGALVEVTDLQGGLLGQTLTAANEKN